jgi:branched-chain amino acid transport system permease protein
VYEKYNYVTLTLAGQKLIATFSFIYHVNHIKMGGMAVNIGLYLQLLVIGLSMGMIYAILAMGIVLLVRAVGVLNFAQGELFMLGAYVCYALTVQLHMPIYAMLIIALLVFVLFGTLFMFAVYWPLRNSKWPATIIISTLGASVVLKEVVKLIWGSVPVVQPPIIKGVLVMGGKIRIEYQYLFIIGIGSLLIIAVFLLFDKLFLGRTMQAAAQDSYAAQLLGIPTVITTALTYIISASLVGIGGWLVSPLFLVSTSLGSFLLKGFAGMVIGGLGDVKGAVIGSLLVGVIESFATLFTATFKDAVVFSVLIIVLIVRPTGFFGQKISEKV